MKQRIVLAYSGGLKASVATAWLAETHEAEVVAMALDLGQGDDMVEVRDRAVAAGALRCHVLDVREEFARDFVIPALKAGALFEGRYPMPTALGRPLIAKALVAIARIEGATVAAHAGTGRDDGRIGNVVRALDPSLRVIAPAEAWTFTGSQLLDYADRHNIPPSSAAESGARADRNLWGRTIGRRLDGGSGEVPETAFAITRPPEDGPDQPAILEIEFGRGAPISLNGVPMPAVELIESLSTIGAEHGLGRLDRVKYHADGNTSHAIYEAPAAVVLHTAHAELQRFVSSGTLLRFSHTVSLAYADLIDRGEWFSPLRPALDAFVNHVEERVTGVIRLRLFKGDCRVTGRTVLELSTKS
jgi:argininosuccinate synthase